MNSIKTILQALQEAMQTVKDFDDLSQELAMLRPAGGMPVHISPLLPMDEGFPCCSLSDRMEWKHLTGKKIHCLVLNGSIFVSKELHSKLASLAA